MGNFKLDNGFVYNDSFTEKDFYDAVIENIRTDYRAPSYIFDEVIMSKVGRINVPLILTDGKADIEYSRVIGYDTYETTTKYKTTTYSNGWQNRSQSSSTRTITNWQNDYGTLSGSAKSGTYDDQYKVYDEYIRDHKMDKSNIRSMSDEELNKYSVSPKMVEFMENDILTKVFENNITYPGQHVKNEEYSGEVTFYNSAVTIVSMYSLAIKIRDKELLFVACTNGDIELKLFGDYPADNFDEVFAITSEISDKRQEATKKERRIVKISILSGIALFILFLVLGLSLNILALTITSFVVLLIGIVLAIIFGVKVKTISKPYNEEIRQHNERDFENKRNHKEESYQSFINKNSQN